MEHGTLVLKNYMINTLIELLNLPLANQTARQRNKFILRLNKIAHELNDQRMVMLKKYGNLDEHGELKTVEGGKYDLKDYDAFEKEYQVLMQEDFKLHCEGEDIVTFSAVENILQSLPTQLNVAQTTVYGEICDAFFAWSNKDI